MGVDPPEEKFGFDFGIGMSWVNTTCKILQKSQGDILAILSQELGTGQLWEIIQCIPLKVKNLRDATSTTFLQQIIGGQLLLVQI